MERLVFSLKQQRLRNFLITEEEEEDDDKPRSS